MGAYTPSVYSHNNQSGTGIGAVIDISACSQGVNPPAMSIIISATATVKVEASHNGLTNWVDFTGGGLTATDSRDLVLSYRFWRSNITANTGTVTTEVGPVATQDGGYASPNLMTVSSQPVL